MRARIDLYEPKNRFGRDQVYILMWKGLDWNILLLDLEGTRNVHTNLPELFVFCEQVKS